MCSSTMNRTLLRLIGAILLSSMALANEYYPYDTDLQGNARGNLDEEGPDGRLFFIVSNATTNVGQFVTFNTTLLFFSAGILLWGVAGGLALYYLLTAPVTDNRYTGYEDYSNTGGYDGRKYSGSFDPYAIDWEKFNIIDWISIGEEAYRKFNPSDLDCQKRLICEIHQNTSKFGAAAAKMVDLFSYLQYAEVLSLPEEFKSLVEEYLDAADRGRSLQKDCGELYDSCDFSVKKMVDKYSHNEI